MRARLADFVCEHTNEIARLETLDVGKPIANSPAVDIPLRANCLLYLAGFADKVYDEIADVQRTQIPPGHPFYAKSQLGAVTEKSHSERVPDYIELGQRVDAKVALGDNRARATTGGFYVEPTIFDEACNDMRIVQEKILGPVVVEIPFKDEAEAIRLEDDSIYGLRERSGEATCGPHTGIRVRSGRERCGSTLMDARR